MNQVEKKLMNKVKQIIFSLLILILPILKTGWSIRVPQYWLWLSGVIILFALSQDDIWISLFLCYCTGLFLLNINIQPYFNLDSIAAYNPIFIAPEFAKDFLRLRIPLKESVPVFFIDAQFYNALIALISICAAVWLISLVQKLNEDWLKVCILYSSYLVFYFWIMNKFDNNWVAGAYLAFCIPLILSCTKKLWLGMIASIIPLAGVFYTKSTAAIIAAIFGMIVFFILKKRYKILIVLLFVIIGLTIFFPQKNFTKFPFRKKVWRQSIEHVRLTWFGTGLRTYKGYGITEGQRTLTTHPHCEFLEVYCEMGIIGLCLLIFFIIDLFYIKCPAEYKAMLISILIHSAIYYPARLAMTGVLIIICIGMIKKYKNNNNYLLKGEQNA